MKPGTKIGLGIFTSLATVALIFSYDFYFKERIDSEEVVVVKVNEEILKSEPITEEKLSIERRSKQALVEGVVLAKDIGQIIGQDSKQDIVGNSMISKKMIDYDELIPDASKGEAIRPITADMIYAQPGSIRRKDVVDIYLVYLDGSTSLHEDGPSKVNSDNDEEEKKQEDRSLPIDSMNTTPFLSDVKVVYVKDSGNKEVVSSSEEQVTDKRLNATALISDLEVILNEEDFTNLMNEVIGKKAKLYITYQ